MIICVKKRHPGRFRKWLPLNLMAPGHGWHIKLQLPTASSQSPPSEDFYLARRQPKTEIQKEEKERCAQMEIQESSITCRMEYVIEHNTSLRCHHTCTRGCAAASDSGDQREGTVEGNNKRWLNYSEFRSIRHGSLQKQVRATSTGVKMNHPFSESESFISCSLCLSLVPLRDASADIDGWRTCSAQLV